jgi:hypothetical protein
LAGFVLQYVPVLDQQVTVHADDVSSDPVGLVAAAGESAVQDVDVSIGDDELMAIPQGSEWSARRIIA